MARVLFLSTQNACRSQMAEGFALARGDAAVKVVSAGLEASSLHPMAAAVMSEVGVNISGWESKSLLDTGIVDFDLVIAMSQEAADRCPVLPGRPYTVQWKLSDPDAIKGDEGTVRQVFRETRDTIRRLVDDLFERGYLNALLEAKMCESVILDNISDGILAHDANRRLFHFNKAAEQITGYSREEVIGRDCHDVFPGKLCGGKCNFCDGPLPTATVHRRELSITSKSGEKRLVDMTIRPLADGKEPAEGFLVSFHDITREHTLARRLGEIENFSGIIGKDERMLEVFDLIKDLADVDVPVLIQGDSGTGKELVAAAIHNEGPRAGKLFVPVSCGALPESLLESELFGHVKGAFTGAIRDKKGRFELANGGTIFLDEIGDISPSVQVKLLRVLQEGHFERVGSEQTLKVDVRIVSATNKDLSAEIGAGRFLEDLYYRLSVVPIQLPPLRERRGDIPLLADHILGHALRTTGKKGIVLSSEALDVMMSYDWPGNIREMQNWIQFALVKCKDKTIRPEHLPPPGPGSVWKPPTSTGQRKRRRLDAASVRAAIAEAQGNKVQAAKLLGVSRATLYRFMDDAGVEK